MLYDKWKPFCFIKFEIVKKRNLPQCQRKLHVHIWFASEGMHTTQHIHTTLYTHIGLQSGWPQATFMIWKKFSRTLSELKILRTNRLSNVNELNHRTEPSCYFCQECNNNIFQMKNYKYGACTWPENWQARFSCAAPPPLFILI